MLGGKQQWEAITTHRTNETKWGGNDGPATQ